MTEPTFSKIKMTLGGAEKGKLVRLSHVHLHEARENKYSKAIEFSVAALIPKDNAGDIKGMKDAIASLKKQMYADNKKPVPPQFWNPLRDGDNDVKQDGTPYGPECKGHYVVNCKTDVDHAPNVVGTQRDADDKFMKLGRRDIKSGDWGRVSIALAGYVKGTGGVGVYLSSVQKVREGDPLGSQSSAEADFKDFDDEDDGMFD